MLTEVIRAGIVETVAGRRRRGAGISPDDVALMFGWLGALRSANTRRAYAGDLNRFIAWWHRYSDGSPLAADAADIERYRRDGVATGVADSTLSRWMSALRSFYGYAVEHGELTISPVGHWAVRSDEPSATDVLASDDVRRLMAACAEIGPRTLALVGLQLYDGIRLGEVVAADADDVTFHGHEARLTVNRRRGGASIRLDRRTALPLQGYLDGRATGPLLLGESPTRGRGRLTRFGADYLLKEAGAAAGLMQPISANVLRRTFAGRLHTQGVPVDTIRDRMGHSDVRTTRRHLDGGST
jgi:integrase/recombinase XerC